jgi:hypothetical protein
MGQLLCIPMAIAGGIIIMQALKMPLPVTELTAAPKTDDDPDAR